MELTKIQSVELVKCDIWEFPEKKSVRVEAIGLVPTGGWTGACLEPVEDPNRPEGVYALNFLALPPDQPSTKVESPIKASYLVEDIPDDLIGVKVIAENSYKICYVKAYGATDEDPTPDTPPEWEKEPTPPEEPGNEKPSHGGWDKTPKPWDKPKPGGWDPKPDPKKPCGCGEACEGGEIECLVGIESYHEKVTIYVYSNGHTKKEHFKWCLHKGCANQYPYILEFCRCVPDRTPCPEPHVVAIEYTCEELCLKPNDQFVVRNPICCRPAKVHSMH